jgi:hypothetical protein
MCFVEVGVADAAAADAPALGAHAPADEGHLLLAAALLELLFLFDLLLHDLGSFDHCLSSGHLLLHKSQTFILLAEACQFIFNDCFDLFF